MFSIFNLHVSMSECITSTHDVVLNEQLKSNKNLFIHVKVCILFNKLILRKQERADESLRIVDCVAVEKLAERFFALCIP